MIRPIVLSAALCLAGCAVQTGNDPATQAIKGAPQGKRYVVNLRESSGEMRGFAGVVQYNSGVWIHINASNMAPGSYGAHLHEVGRCDPPGFTTAGGHWNPTGRQHGRDNPRGAHNGDLPNLAVGGDGHGILTFTIPGATLNGGAGVLMDADGASIVIHAAADDYRTDPSGNSGARIACGALR